MTTQDDNSIYNKSDSGQGNAPRSNVPEFSVSDLAFSLKKTLEDTYSRVRVRGELSRVSIAGSGHMYSTLKDDRANIDTICWKGVLSKLPIRPEEGMEVICTGRISTYPARSNYQLIIETMELAGEGALLKMLEERKKKLASEGLFAAERKKKLPYLPQVIGVVTSPTGAVIRDILHRLSDRFPRNVLVWPVLVQGEGAAAQVSAAIRGFDAIKPGGDVLKPDLLIVARGGGSLEDLMPFNDEDVVRAVSECSIPVISAVGHETDTTLCDFAADQRAPTPTGAAEIAVPVREDLRAHLMESEHRLYNGWMRLTSEYKHKLESVSAKLGDPAKLLEVQIQNLDFLSTKIAAAFASYLQQKSTRLIEKSGQLIHPRYLIECQQQALENVCKSFENSGRFLLRDKDKDLEQSARMLETLSFKRTLERGFVVVRDGDGHVVPRAENIHGDALSLEFQDGKADVILEGAGALSSAPKKIKQKKKTLESNSDKAQESLF